MLMGHQLLRSASFLKATVNATNIEDGSANSSLQCRNPGMTITQRGSASSPEWKTEEE